jgi:small subunit ribosomal protein S19
MSRSNYKSYYIKYNFILNLKKKKKSKNVIIQDKSLTILPQYVNQFIKVYNGKKAITLKIHEGMIGYKFGEFLYTRQKFSFKKK